MSSQDRSFVARLLRAWRKSGAGRWWRYDCTLIVYRMDRPPQPRSPDPGSGVGRNCGEHLERYVSAGQYVGRDRFLRTCAARIAAGEHVYTVCPADRLLAYAWMVPNQARSWMSAVQLELRYPPHSCVLYNAYTLPEARGRGYNTLLARERLADAYLRFGAEVVFSSVEAGNDHAARAKLAVGFRPWREITFSTRLGRSRHGERNLWDAEDPGARRLRHAGSPTSPGISTTVASTGLHHPGT